LPWLSLESYAQSTTRLDLAFQRWGAFYMPGHDWRWWKAQAIAESGLRPDAVSSCGARGIMQLMPATARELGVNPVDPEANIQGGIKYDRRLWDFWKSISTAEERRRFAFGSYNAGPGNIQKAARGAPPSWQAVAGRLPAITGAHASETVNYIKRIEATFQRLQ
jgi:membrane-bound lytic murein transglycosylase F